MSLWECAHSHHEIACSSSGNLAIAQEFFQAELVEPPWSWTVTKLIRKLWNDEEGATMVEYALMALLIAVAAVGAVTLFGAAVGSSLSSSATAVAAAG